jgi:hypothetical protein
MQADPVGKCCWRGYGGEAMLGLRGTEQADLTCIIDCLSTLPEAIPYTEWFSPRTK